MEIQKSPCTKCFPYRTHDPILYYRKLFKTWDIWQPTERVIKKFLSTWAQGLPKLYSKVVLHGTLEPGFLFCFPFCQSLAVELPNISELSNRWPISSYSQAAWDTYTCMHVASHMWYESGKQGEAQGQRKETVMAEESCCGTGVGIPKWVSLPGWTQQPLLVTSSHSHRCGYPGPALVPI